MVHMKLQTNQIHTTKIQLTVSLKNNNLYTNSRCPQLVNSKFSCPAIFYINKQKTQIGVFFLIFGTKYTWARDVLFDGVNDYFHCYSLVFWWWSLMDLQTVWFVFFLIIHFLSFKFFLLFRTFLVHKSQLFRQI